MSADLEINALSSREKRDALVRLLKKKAAGRKFHPLSFAQQRMWFLDQLHPGSSLYNIVSATKLEGPLEVGMLIRTLTHLVERQESLRTTFKIEDGEPVQVIAAPSPVALPVVDLRALDGKTRDRVVPRMIDGALRRPFDLASGPLMRLCLLRTGETRHVFVLTMHHIISDAWSMGLIAKEIARVYEAFTANLDSPLEPLAMQYRDYAFWQRQWMRGRSFDKAISYWREQLAGAPPHIELPTDRPRPMVLTNRGRVRYFSWPAELIAGLKRVGRSRDTTLFMTLLAGLQALLFRITSQRDLTVGFPISGRHSVETEALIGLFINTLVLRSKLSPESSFEEHLDNVREAAIQAYSHKELPFEKLVEELKPERNLSQTPLFNVICSMQDGAPAAAEVRFAGLRSRPIPPDTEKAPFDLEMMAGEVEGKLLGVLRYKSELFDDTTIRRFLEHFRALLARLIAQPGRALAEISFLSESERHQILEEWNATEVDQPLPAMIHRWIENEAARAPDAVALAFDERVLTYEEMDARADRLATVLLGLGVRPEVPVAISVERSLELVVALLAILKSGGAYVPLDTSYPRERLGFMLDDAFSAAPDPVLIARREGTDVPVAGRVKVVAAEAVAPDDSAPDTADPHPEGLAYVIYTSGSTGRPKGVMNSHRGICNRLLWMQQFYGLDSTDKVLQKTPMSFDVSVWEFFWPLMVGAQLVLARPEGHKDSDHILELIETRRVTTLHFVPSMLQVFVEGMPAGCCRSLRRVVTSGEALPRDLVERFQSKLGAEIHNLYGPTEAAVDVTYHRCERGARGSVPIGRPIANTAIFIATAPLRTAAIGVAGELLIGGTGLARGYLRRPGLTAGKFVPHPHSREPGERLYRTGDLARFQSSGEIEFLGRIDHQVKLRGFRIELEEIAAVLQEHPEVNEVAVMVREDLPGGRALVAHLVPRGTPPDESGLRVYLRERLPEYMIPAYFVAMDSFPYLPNGKLDRKALLRTDLETPGAKGKSRNAGRHPRSPVAETISAIWTEVLGVEEFGDEDNFFDLGGHSILMVEVMRKLKERLERDLTMLELFQHPTIGSLAAHLGGELARTDAEKIEGYRARLLAGRERIQRFRRQRPRKTRRSQ